MRRRRLELGLWQREVAEKIGVNPTTIYRWERNETRPPGRSMSRIIEFLGYVPYLSQSPRELGRARKGLGLR
ncbi:MAG: helix-turn-helix transcriptional regulator [Deltaproteobacteria bacterium]|nr:helix-turn-helix transcriptional regulator [Deltaproteobacteria bacterium]